MRLHLWLEWGLNNRRQIQPKKTRDIRAVSCEVNEAKTNNVQGSPSTAGHPLWGNLSERKVRGVSKAKRLVFVLSRSHICPFRRRRYRSPGG